MVKRILIVVVVLALLGGGGWWAWITYGDGTAKDAAEAPGGTGTIEAAEVAVSALVPGRIVEVLAEEGSDVTSGTPLFRLDSKVLDLQVAQAEAGVKAAQAALDQIKTDKGTKGEIDQAQARVDAAQAALEIARAQAEFAVVLAPFDGTITGVSAALGETASPGKTLGTLADLTALTIKVYVPETEIGTVTIGRSATVTTNSSDRTFAAEVIRIASEAEFTPGNIETKEQRVKLVYEVELSVDDSEGILKPGMLADVTFE